MPTTTINGKKGDWKVDITQRNPGADTIRIKYTPKKEAKGCKNIRVSQTVREDAYDAAGKHVTSSEKDMLRDPNGYGRGWQKPDEVEDTDKAPVVIDHVRCEADPYYNGDDVPHDGKSQGDATVPTPTELDDTPGSPNGFGFGRYKANIAKVVFTFEVCAICADTGAILGCITWKTEITAGNGGDISAGNKESDPSGTFKKAFRKFVKTHTKKKGGKLHWYCPETGDPDPLTPGGKVLGPTGDATKPYGGEVPEDFQKLWVAGVKKGESTRLDKGNAGKGRELGVGQAVEEALARPGRAGLKFTWAGMQIKTVPSIVLTAYHAVDEDSLSRVANPDDAYTNDFYRLVVQQVEDSFMTHAVDLLGEMLPPLEEDESYARVSILANLDTALAGSFDGSLNAEQLNAFLVTAARHESTDEETLRLLTYLNQNFAYLPPGAGSPGGSNGPVELDPDIRRVEGIDDGLRERLLESGITDLQDLADTDATRTRVSGIGKKRLQGFTAMARMLVAYPELDGNDAELLVKGLGVSDPEMLSRLDETAEARVETGLRELKLPADYNPERVRRLLRGSRNANR